MGQSHFARQLLRWSFEQRTVEPSLANAKMTLILRMHKSMQGLHEKAFETVSVSFREEHQPTVVSNALTGYTCQ